MPKSKTVKRTRKSKNKFSPHNHSTKKLGFIVFVVLFAAVGSYLILKSFANELPVPQGEKTLVERRNSFETAQDGERLVEAETISFRLYQSGLAICGGYSDNAHPERYYSTQLTELQKDAFLSSIFQTGFFSLNTSSGPLSVVTSAEYQQLGVLHGNVGKVAIADSRSPNNPQAYIDTNTLIDSLCATLATPYQPFEVEVTAKIVADSVPANGGTLAPEIKIKESAGRVEKKKFKEIEARKVNKSLGKTGKKVFKKGTKSVEVRVDEVLPQTIPVQDGINSNLTSINLSGISLPSPFAKVSAATPPIKFYRLCATDGCPLNQNLGQYVTAASEFFARNIKQKMNIMVGGKYTGNHTQAWYRTCHGYIHTCSSTRTTIHSVLENITWEIQNERGWQYDSPKMFMLGFDSNSSVACGTAYLGPGGRMIGVVDSTNTLAGTSCSQNRFQYVAAVHEFGHILGLNHVTDNSLMHAAGCGGSNGSYSQQITQCKINMLQAAWLITNSNWLSPI